MQLCLDPIINDAFLDSLGWEQANFIPNTNFKVTVRRRLPTDPYSQILQQQQQQQRPLPPPPLPAGGALLRRPPLPPRLAPQQPPSPTERITDPKLVTMERIVGEIAFQLDRRILSSIFPDRVRLYGYTISNIPEKILQGASDPLSPLSQEQRTSMTDRYNSIMNLLKPKGYDPNVHSKFTEHIVNTFGILRERPDVSGPEGDSYNNPSYLRQAIEEVAPPDKVSDCLILLDCLCYMAAMDGKPLFIW
ncbi:speriolin-like [Rhineura floridana]|uniref:speriolin-like n=1 Tax=Rhineura floridana TaxID=261503 RepID=UPI002AC87D2B|nr:speriolin-like [Rhineura floridana]